MNYKIDKDGCWVELVIQSMMTKCELSLPQVMEVLTTVYKRYVFGCGWDYHAIDEVNISLNDFCIQYNNGIRKGLDQSQKFNMKTIFNEFYDLLDSNHCDHKTFNNPITRKAYRMAVYGYDHENDYTEQLYDLWESVDCNVIEFIINHKFAISANDLIYALSYATQFNIPEEAGKLNEYKGINVQNMTHTLYMDDCIGKKELIREIYGLWTNAQRNWGDKSLEFIKAFVDTLTASMNGTSTSDKTAQRLIDIICEYKLKEEEK